MKQRIYSIMVFAGFMIMMFGCAAGDSEDLTIPAIFMITGAVITLAGNIGMEKTGGYEDEETGWLEDSGDDRGDNVVDFISKRNRKGR